MGAAILFGMHDRSRNSEQITKQQIPNDTSIFQRAVIGGFTPS